MIKKTVLLFFAAGSILLLSSNVNKARVLNKSKLNTQLKRKNPVTFPANGTFSGWIDFNKNGKMDVYEDPSQNVDKRVNDLVSRMTFEEKLSQMQNGSKAIPRLGIPKYNWWSECLHGVAANGIATVFPQAIGMAATWDPDLIHQEADVISTEARAKHNEDVKNGQRNIFQGLTFWSPNVNLFRDPRWGRGQETYGEDPFLESKIGVAFVKGLQGDDPKYFKVISTPKHFVVHSGPEPLRHKFNAVTSERDFYESYLPAFKACVMEGKAYSVMGAYSAYKGIPCCASSFLLDTILRQQFGFKGYVVSDCGAITDIYKGHKYAKTAAEASALAVKAGCDLTCGREYPTLSVAVDSGFITKRQIDKSVKRLMTARFRLGMFDPPEMVSYSRIPISENDTKEHRQLALKIARKSMVLLKNKENLLPLDKNIKTIAVIGPYANNINVLLGNYNGTPSQPVTILQGIKNRADTNIKVSYAKGVEPIESYGRYETVESKYLRPSGDDKANGLFAEYFDNPDLKGKPVISRVEKRMVFWWVDFSYIKDIPKNISVRLSGTLMPDEDGTFNIRIITSDKGRFYFNNKLVFDNWNSHDGKVMKPFKVDLKKGKAYPVKIEYAEEEGNAHLEFQWQKVQINNLDTSKMKTAVQIAEKSDVAVVVVGISPRLEGEEMPVHLEGFKGGDRTSLDLPAPYEKLLQTVANTGKPVVLVLTGGSALSVNWAQAHIPAIIMAWYPGEEGGNALADILFGKVNPSGKLPVTFYHSVKDLPPFTDYFMKGRTYRYFGGKPLYPFGYGLSYTTFDYMKMNLSKTNVSITDTVKITVTLKNNGKMDGAEIVQLYVRNLNPGEPQPIKSLKGFKRIFLSKGETGNVVISLPVSELAYYHTDRKAFSTDPGQYELQVGASSADVPLKMTLHVLQ